MNKNLIADVLEKAASYFDEVSREQENTVKEAREKEASRLQEKLSSFLGENIDVAVLRKLASAGPEVAGLIEKIAGSALTDSLGGPDNTVRVKTASTHSGSPAAESFTNWLMS
jgi:hypothetical protein